MTTLTFPLPTVSRPTYGPVAGSRARDVQVRDAADAPRHLAELWVDAPRALALTFVRQYGCPLCRQQVRDLRRHHTLFADAGVAIAVVGQGSAREAARFREEMDLPFPVLADPTRAAYATYGLPEGTLEQVFDPTPGRPFFAAMLRGNLPGRTVGSVRQLPGTFVIDRDGIVRAAHPARHAGDVPDPVALLQHAVETIPLARPR